MEDFGFKAFWLIEQKAGGEALRDLEEGGVVRDGEGLQRSVGTDAVGADGLEVGRVEGGEEWVGRAAVEEGVHGAAIAVGTGACLPALAVLGEGIDAIVAILCLTP